MSAGTSETQVGGEAGGTISQGVAAKADFKIGFNKEDSVYFLLTDCVGTAIENQFKLGADILERVKTKDWRLDYVVVTRVVTAGSATILQAKTKGASLVLEGTANDSALNLLNAGASVNIKSQSSIGFSAVGKGKLTPLFTLGKVDYGILDAVLDREGKFTSATNVKTAKIGIGKFKKMVASNRGINFASSTGGRMDYEEMTVALPKYGNHVDINDLVDLAIHAGFELPTKAESVEEISSLDLCNRRVRSKRIRSLIDQVAGIELETDPVDSDHFLLNVSLPKSGKTVDVKPLIELAAHAIEPTATVKAEFTFREIE